MISLPHIKIAVTFSTVTYVVTHESTQNKIYLHNYEITCNLFFYCRISLTIFSTYEFCSKFYTVTTHILEFILLYM